MADARCQRSRSSVRLGGSRVENVTCLRLSANLTAICAFCDNSCLYLGTVWFFACACYASIKIFLAPITKKRKRHRDISLPSHIAQGESPAEGIDVFRLCVF